MEKINYEVEVKKIHPDAKCIGVGFKGKTPKQDTGPLLYMIIGCRLGENYNAPKSKAWKFAYDNLNIISPKSKKYEHII